MNKRTKLAFTLSTDHGLSQCRTVGTQQPKARKNCFMCPVPESNHVSSISLAKSRLWAPMLREIQVVERLTLRWFTITHERYIGICEVGVHGRIQVSVLRVGLEKRETVLFCPNQSVVCYGTWIASVNMKYQNVNYSVDSISVFLDHIIEDLIFTKLFFYRSLSSGHTSVPP